MELEEIIDELEALSTPENIDGMARFGITPEKTFAVRIPELRKIAKKAGKDHSLAEKLWKFNYRETKILACMIEEPELVSSIQMDKWVLEFDYWEICDQCCMNLFRKTAFAYDKIFEWSEREEEFVKIAAFTLIAVMDVHDKEAHDDQFEKFFPLIIENRLTTEIMLKKLLTGH